MAIFNFTSKQYTELLTNNEITTRVTDMKNMNGDDVDDIFNF